MWSQIAILYVYIIKHQDVLGENQECWMKNLRYYQGYVVQVIT